MFNWGICIQMTDLIQYCTKKSIYILYNVHGVAKIIDRYQFFLITFVINHIFFEMKRNEKSVECMLVCTYTIADTVLILNLSTLIKGTYLVNILRIIIFLEKTNK